MPSLTRKLCEEQYIVGYPGFFPTAIHYEVITGSHAYGVSTDTSDIDIGGFCIPPREVLFPYRFGGHIEGFDDPNSVFKQYQKSHIKRRNSDRFYDVTIYSINKFFSLCMQNNPNMIDTLFVPDECIIHMTAAGELVRRNRYLFLSKRVFYTFSGYAFQQMSKIKSGKGKQRVALVAKYGYDVKSAYHALRLLDECIMLLTEHDLDLTRSKDRLIEIRNGEWSKDELLDYFTRKDKEVKKAYERSKLNEFPDKRRLKKLLLECIEIAYEEDEVTLGVSK